MAPLRGFIGGSYRGRALAVSAERSANLYPEKVEDPGAAQKADWILLPRPGLASFASLGLPTNPAPGGSGGSSNVVPPPFTLAMLLRTDIGGSGAAVESTNLSPTSISLTTHRGLADYNATTADACSMAYVTTHGPCTMTVRCASEGGGGTFGLMARASLNPGAVNEMIASETPGWWGWTRVAPYYRQYGDVSGQGNFFDSNAQPTGVSGPPLWFKLQYLAAGQVSTWWSNDGATWHALRSNITIGPAGGLAYVGICLATASASYTAVADNLSVVWA